MKSRKFLFLFGLCAMLTACSGGGEGDGGNSTTPHKSISLAVTGLASGSELTLVNNDTVPIKVKANGESTTQIPVNSNYSFTIDTQPAGQLCKVSNGTGTASGSGPNNVEIACFVPPSLNVSTEVTTFSGSGVEGYFDGEGAVAKFSSPHGIAVDSAGIIYVADTYNNVIRKVTPTGSVSTLAGSTTMGRADGVGSSASFYHPYGVTVDSRGNVYVADTGNNLIRKISPDGEVTTVAGSGFPGSVDGAASQATFYLPSDLKFDSAGNLYVTDTGYGLIRKLSPAGVVTTVSGSNTPHGIGIDSKGNVYAACWNSAVISKTTPTGVGSFFAGSGLVGSANGLGSQASFSRPYFIAVDSDDNVYVSEATEHPLITTVNMRIRVITPLGMVSDYAGSGAKGSLNGSGSAATFNDPTGIAFDSAGNLYVAESSNNVIRKIRRVD